MKPGQFIGRRRVFVWGLVAFTIGVMLASLAPNVGILILARALQGVGASVIVPTSLALLLEAYPKPDHKRMISIWAAAGSLAAALGPVLGGLLADLDWRLVFALKIPLALVALFAARALPTPPRKASPLPDLVGAACLAVTIASFITVLTMSSEGKPDQLRLWVTAALGISTFGLFLYRSMRHPDPVVDLRLFKTPSFSFAAVGMAAFYVGFSMMLLACALWATNVWEWSSALTGICFILGPGTAVVTSLIAGRTNLKAEWLSLGGGLLFMVAGLIWALSLTTENSSPVAFLAGFILTGAAAGIAQTGFLSGGAGALPEEDYASGTGIINTGRQIGAAVGVALLVAFVGSGDQAVSFGPVWVTISISGATAALAILPAITKLSSRTS
nr:MFS transporter [Leucobacter soli]